MDKINPKLVVFGETLKNFRLSRGMTQLELGDKADSAESVVSKVELGKMNPSLIWILKVAEALEIDPCLLIDPLHDMK